MTIAVGQKGELMSDLISRQAAIDAIQKERHEAWEDLKDDTEYRKGYDDGLAESMRIVTDDLPSAQPDNTCKFWDSESNFCALNRPSAQPEIIRCKDCKLFGDEKCLMCFDGYDWAEPDGYCHYAERRTDEPI